MKKLLFFLFLPFLLQAEQGYKTPWGKDKDLCEKTVEITPPQKTLSSLGILSEKIIRFHHRAISHISGPRSHFRPSSSHYMLEAIQKYGFVKGYLMGCDRLLRENSDPWIYKIKYLEGKHYQWDPPN